MVILVSVMANTLGKNQRLKGKKVVAEIFGGKKKTLSSFPFRAFYSVEKSDSPISKFGFSVSKKRFKKAVDRNKIKRLIKEAVRLNKTILEKELYKQSKSLNTMIVFNGDSMPNFNLVEVKIKDLLSRLAQSINENEEN